MMREKKMFPNLDFYAASAYHQVRPSSFPRSFAAVIALPQPPLSRSMPRFLICAQCGVPTNFMTPIFVIARTAGQSDGMRSRCAKQPPRC
jgi:citrate synthase